jgi:hypothetical protein
MGARGLESDTFFEMALRDAQLVPGLEGSTHINLTTAAQFIARYFSRQAPQLPSPSSLLTSKSESAENNYLLQARTGSTNTISFPHFLSAYAPLIHIPNIRLFTRQAKAFQIFLDRRNKPASADDSALAIAHCFSIIAYAQLIAENSRLLQIQGPLISAIFHTLITDLSTAALNLASHPAIEAREKRHLCRLIAIPSTSADDWEAVAHHISRH